MKYFKKTKPYMYNDQRPIGFIEYKFLGTLAVDLPAQFQEDTKIRQESSFKIPAGSVVDCTMREWVRPSDGIKTTLSIEFKRYKTTYEVAFQEMANATAAAALWGIENYRIS